MLKRTTSNTDRRRRRSSIAEGEYKLDLDAGQLECLILSLADQSNDKHMRSSYKARYFGLTDRMERDAAERADSNGKGSSSNSGAIWTQAELFDIISALQELLSTVEEPSSTMVADVHSTIGIIHQRLNHDARATQSFLQALWVQTSCDDVPPVTLGLTKMRLALAYGRKGQNSEAISTLEKAISDFRLAGLDDDHELVAKATEALQAFHMAVIHKLHRRNSRRISQGAA